MLGLLHRAVLFAALIAAGSSADAASTAEEVGLAVCVPGRTVEANAAGTWTSATVIKRHANECIVRLRYAGVENTWYVSGEKVRPVSSRAEHLQVQAGKPGKPVGGTTVIDTSPEEAFADFNRDYAAARAKYFGRRVRISGVPSKLQDGRLYFFRLGYDLAATCDFPDVARAQLARLKLGYQRVVVTGYAQDTAGRYTLRLDQCVLNDVLANPPVASEHASILPYGRYNCTNAGQGAGFLDLAASTYTVGGVTGSYYFNPATSQITFRSGSYARWGWEGRWRTDARNPGGPIEPRIELSDGIKLNVRCYRETDG